jgi:hypothetical protein
MRIETARTILGYVKQYVDLSTLKLKASMYDWYYSVDEQRVVFAVEYPEQYKQSDIWISDYIYDVYGYRVEYEYMEIFRILHEVGHHISGPICTQEEYYYLRQEAGTDRYVYRQIPDEKAADLFAVEFMQEHLNNILSIL